MYITFESDFSISVGKWKLSYSSQQIFQDDDSGFKFDTEGKLLQHKVMVDEYSVLPCVVPLKDKFFKRNPKMDRNNFFFTSGQGSNSRWRPRWPPVRNSF